jgi:hypothetical protein
MSRDIKQVLEEKLRELRICQQYVACLKIVLPLLVEDGDKPEKWEPPPPPPDRVLRKGGA